MRIEYDPFFEEKVVQCAIEKDSGLFNKYRDLLDQIYELPMEKRPDSIFMLNRYFFVRLKLHEKIKKLLSEFPQFECAVRQVEVKLPFDNSEDATLNSRSQTIVIKISPHRFLSEKLEPFLRHELMHVADMINPEFCYKIEPSPLDIIRQRYGIIWDIHIDSRLTHLGKETIADKKIRQKEFENLFHMLELKSELFEILWSTGKLTHNEILTHATDPLTLYQRLPEKNSTEKSLPGKHCPLCQFPTYKWGDFRSLAEPTVSRIRSDFPSWSVSNGICERCLEYYVMVTV